MSLRVSVYRHFVVRIVAGNYDYQSHEYGARALTKYSRSVVLTDNERTRCLKGEVPVPVIPCRRWRSRRKGVECAIAYFSLVTILNRGLDTRSSSFL